MVPAFGFSVGDFIAAIQLTVKISKALRETGGASTECRLVIQDLRNLQQVLEMLQCLKPAGGDLSHINAIRGMAIACLLPLREFAEKIDRSYGPISGARSSHHFLRRSGKSIQWSVFATEELARFRVVIAAKVASIGLLLGVFNCQSLSTIENGSQITNTLLAQAAERRDLLHKELAQQATTHHGGLSADITEARTQIKNKISSAEGEAGKRHDHLINRAEQHTNDLRALGHRMDRVYGDTCSNIKDVVDVCFRARLGNEQRFRSAERRFQKLGVEIKSLRYQQQQTSSRVSSSLQAVFVQIQIVRAIGAGLLGSLIPFSEKVLRYLRDNMQSNLETYALLLKILENGDLILFQDILGRTKSLPYEYFRHWDIFESMLRCEFKGLPGEDKVLQGQYLIMDGTLPGVEIGRHAWQEKVFPGTSVKMSVVIQSLHFLRGVCPRPGCHGKIVSPEEFAVAQCPYCGLAFAPQSPSQIRTAADEELTLRSLEELDFEWEEIRTLSPASKTSFSDTLSTDMEAQREERLKQEYDQAGRELRGMMVFRMVHILQRSIIKPKAGHTTDLSISVIRTLII